MSFYESVLILVMRDEIATTMRLLGVTRLDQLGPHLVCLLFTDLHDPCGLASLFPSSSHHPRTAIVERSSKKHETKDELNMDFANM